MRIERVRGPLRRAFLPAEDEPVCSAFTTRSLTTTAFPASAKRHMRRRSTTWFCQNTLTRSGLGLVPEQAALLCQLDDQPRTADELAGELHIRLARVVELEHELTARGLVSDGDARIDLNPAGRRARAQLLEAGEAELKAEYPDLRETGGEAAAVLQRLSRSFLQDQPAVGAAQ